MSKAFVVFISICLLILCSCQKEVDPIDITNNTDSLIAVNDSKSLVKYIDLDTTFPSGLDTQLVVKYTYDNLKRVSQLDYVEYGSTGTPDRNFKIFLYYNGTDTLPYKKLMKKLSLPANTVTDSTVKYYYYTNGKLTADSTSETSSQFQYHFITTKRFSYTTNKISEVTTSYSNTGNSTETRDYYFTKVNGNNTSQKDTSQVSTILVNNFAFSYDGKKNPYYNLPQTTIDREDPYYHMETYSDEMVYEINNPLEINEFHNQENFHLKYIYEYKANGYPSVARVYDLSIGTGIQQGFFFKRLFFYTKL